METNAQQYVRTAIIGGPNSAHPFRRSLAGIAIGVADQIYALGDGEVRMFEPDGTFLLGYKVVENATCLAAAADGRVFVGAPGRVEFYDSDGRHTGGFPAGEKDKPAAVTKIKIVGKEVLVADAAARIIRRYDMKGVPQGLIGTANKTGTFMLPNKWLDFDVDSKGVVRASDTGRHQVSAWALDGSRLGAFGKFGMQNPADFVGCCNPVNLTIAPDGKVVTGEKVAARVKIFEPAGKLLAVIGPEHFDAKCIHIHLAVDSKGRILAADPVRREVKIFSPATKVEVKR
ncbi:MAG: hypothetical protein EHM61_09485 [Acidobacteria bacterium]|nr:MAG: hypothetical protein EHM61_09485 [Acidobacteriota bacterium]